MAHSTPRRRSVVLCGALALAALGLSGSGPALSPASAQTLNQPSPTPITLNVYPFRTLSGAIGGTEAAYGVAVDGSGNKIAAGSVWSAGKRYDFTVAKYGLFGLLWERRLNGTANSDDAALAVAVDAQNNIYAAGYTTNTGTGGDFTLAKWDPAGNLLWSRTLDGGQNRFDAARALTIDADGNPVAAGSLTRHYVPAHSARRYHISGYYINVWVEEVEGSDIAVMKWDPAGNPFEGWKAVGVPDPVTVDLRQEGEEAALDVAVDHQGNVIAAGTSFTVMKWSPTSKPVWTQPYRPGGQHDEWRSVAVDSEDNILVAGKWHRRAAFFGEWDSDWAIVKVGADGVQQFRRDYEIADTNGNTSNAAQSLAVDSGDNVVVGGYLDHQFTVAKLDPSLTELWKTVLPAYWGGVNAVALGPGDSVYAAGYRAHAHNQDREFTAVILEPWGAERWRLGYTRPAGHWDEAYAIAVNSQGRWAAAGKVESSATGEDFAVTR